MLSISLVPNVRLHIQQTKQFKDVTFSIRFLNSIENCDNTIRFFLSQLLSDRCKVYPTKLDVTKKLDQLYGAQIHGTNDFIGLSHMIELRCSVINGQYVNENLLEEQIKMLADFTLTPILNDEVFFEEIKQRLLLMVASFNDNLSSYASDRAQSHFNSLEALKTVPTKEEIEKVTLKAIQEAYEKMINEETIEFFALGDIDFSTTTQLVQKYFSFSERSSKEEAYAFHSLRDSHETITEEKDLQQNHLILYYTTETNILDKQHFALLVGNGLFGALPSSLLFQEVREKRSLCYSIHSLYESFDGLIKVQTAISKESLEEAQILINQQVERVRNGDFSEELLNSTKKMLINSITSSNDNQKRIIDRHFNNLLLKKERTLPYLIQCINSVTIGDIQQVFSLLQLKLTYILTQGGTTDENSQQSTV